MIHRPVDLLDQDLPWSLLQQLAPSPAQYCVVLVQERLDHRLPVSTCLQLTFCARLESSNMEYLIKGACCAIQLNSSAAYEKIEFSSALLGT